MSLARHTDTKKLESLPWVDHSGSCPECGNGFLFFAVKEPTAHGRGRECRECDYQWVPKPTRERP